MTYYLVCPIGVISGRDELLTYHSEASLHAGTVVEIPFGKQQKLGVIMSTTQQPSFATKPISNALPETIPQHLLDLAVWIQEYYAARLTTVFQTLLPKGLGKKRRETKASQKKFFRKENNAELTAEQQQAVNAIKNSKAITHLLHGVTGSGKTRVYQELAREQLIQNRSVLILVPEIALTPQLATEFETLSQNVMVLHSAQTEAERHKNWVTLKNTTEPWIVIGPRSTLFSPLANTGLIVVDECHEPSFVQDSQPKYSALRVARKLAEVLNAQLILGSATPLVADYYVAKQTQTPIITLKKPVTPKNTSVEIVDMREREAFGTHSLFSKKLLEAMHTAITQNEQILLFHNRRGTARVSLCSSCGWLAECPNCHVPFRLHHDDATLRCHMCGRSEVMPHVCPVCKNPSIDFKGFGSKRIEAEVRKLFPSIQVARFDSDTPLKEQLHHRYQDLYDGVIQIIIGTQGIAKGLDLPKLNTVGIIQADSELFIPDFASTERSFQLTTQVIGRAGRTGAKSNVIIQTLNPDHPALQLAAKQDYSAFYDYEIKERFAEHTPPATYLLQLTTGYTSTKSAEAAAQKLASIIRSRHTNAFVRGPAPAFHEHRGALYYQQLVVSSHKRSTLTAIAKELPQRWQFTLDPLNLL